jgi:hypothetical protein
MDAVLSQNHWASRVRQHHSTSTISTFVNTFVNTFINTCGERPRIMRSSRQALDHKDGLVQGGCGDMDIACKGVIIKN